MNIPEFRVGATCLHFLPVETRLPLKFGSETLTSATLARASITLQGAGGRAVTGWGETPLSVQWVWPSRNDYEPRLQAMRAFSIRLTEAWRQIGTGTHPIDQGYVFQRDVLPALLRRFNAEGRAGAEPMPWLAALVCCSVFDQAYHDAYGRWVDRPIYETYTPEFMPHDLSAYLEPATDTSLSFRGRYPSDYLIARPPSTVRAWHLVGGLDLLDAAERTGSEPNDGYPVLLSDWIERDGLKCLKIKLRGNDAEWDYQRLVRVGRLAVAHEVEWLTADFNCTVTEPAYVNAMLDRLRDEQPRLYGMILYVEQPFPYELGEHRIDAHSISARKPLFLDESAHDWQMIRLGRELGWTGVALKTCKTQTGAILSACWAKAHGMTLMVQDLTNPMLAQIPHILLAAHVGTIMGVETNAMQFYPEASNPEAMVHPGLYRRRHGAVDLSTVAGPGFGYRLEEMRRELPAAAAAWD